MTATVISTLALLIALAALAITIRAERQRRVMMGEFEAIQREQNRLLDNMLREQITRDKKTLSN